MKKRIRISIGSKASLVIFVIFVIVSLVSILVSYSMYSKVINNHYSKMATNIGRTVVARLEGDKLDGYLETKVKDDAYDRMLKDLFDIKDNNDILYLYVIKVTEDSVYSIMDADLGETAYELGERFDIADTFRPYIGHLENGTPALITNTKFGWLCTAHSPVFNSKGEVTALVGVDISMNEVMKDKHSFLLMIVISTVSAALILSVIILKLTRIHIIIPINKLSVAAAEYITERNNGLTGELSTLSSLDIRTGDELEILCNTIKAMDHDINLYIDNLTKLTSEKERMGAILSVATSIQSNMLPCIFPAFPDRREFDIHASMMPAKEVSGDFYDFFLVNDTHLGIVIADVSGKGVPAALFMVIAKTLIRNQAQNNKSPAEVFTIVNAQLCANNQANMFVTAFMGILDLQTGMLEYANAGHNIPLLYKVNEGYHWLKSKPSFVLAGMTDMRYKQYRVLLNPGDRLFLYTDGVTEVMNCQDEKYSEIRLFEALNQPIMRDFSIGEVDEFIQSDIHQFMSGTEQHNDITLLLLEFKEYYSNENIFSGSSEALI